MYEPVAALIASQPLCNPLSIDISERQRCMTAYNADYESTTLSYHLRSTTVGCMIGA